MRREIKMSTFIAPVAAIGLAIVIAGLTGCSTPTSASAAGQA